MKTLLAFCVALLLAGLVIWFFEGCHFGDSPTGVDTTKIERIR